MWGCFYCGGQVPSSPPTAGTTWASYLVVISGAGPDEAGRTKAAVALGSKTYSASSGTRLQASHDLVSWLQALNCGWDSEQCHVPQLWQQDPHLSFSLHLSSCPDELFSGPWSLRSCLILPLPHRKWRKRCSWNLACGWGSYMHHETCAVLLLCPGFLIGTSTSPIQTTSPDCVWLTATSSRSRVTPAGLDFLLAASAQAVPPTPDFAQWVEFQSSPHPVCPVPL